MKICQEEVDPVIFQTTLDTSTEKMKFASSWTKCDMIPYKIVVIEALLQELY